eukprot:COSAG04_NODE_26284_length_297_cov_0.515152_1_plen_29_part_01
MKAQSGRTPQRTPVFIPAMSSLTLILAYP